MGAFQTVIGNQGQFGSFLGDCFVAKYDSAGNLSYSTYVGGSSDETALGIALDSLGNAYITGETASPDFPSTAGALRTANGGVFRTTNSAALWAPVDSGLTSSNLQALTIDPQVPATIYAGTRDGGIFKSTDGASSWVAISNGLTDMSVQAIAVNPLASNVVYLGTSSRGVFRSTNGGASWNAVDTGEGGSSITSLVIDPAATGTIYAATSSGVFKTTNAGATWTGLPIPGIFGPVQSVALDPANHSTVYEASGGVFKSTDGGTTWSHASPSFNVGALALDPSSAIYAATSLGVQKSTDGGATWNLKVAGMTDLNVLAIAAGPSAVYAGTNSGVFKSTNGGSSWAASNTGIVGSAVTAVAIDPVTQANVYAGSTGGGTHAFVTKLNVTGTGLVYSTYLGGNNRDVGTAIAVDSNDNAYVTGLTQSATFPITPGGVPPLGPFFNGSVGYISKLNVAGTGLVYSTMLDNQGFSTTGNGIAVDSSFNAYVVGQTSNSNYPVTAGAYQTRLTGQSNAFISKVLSSPGLSADLQISQTEMPTGTISSGVTYNVTITNNGPDPAYSVTLIDSLPAGLVTTNCSGTGINCQETSDGVVATTPSPLAPGAMATLTVSAFVNCATAVNNTTATNTVTVSSLTPDPVPGNNSASVSNTVSNAGATSISPQSATFPAAGVSFSRVSVTAPSCEWQASSNVSWIFLFFSSGSGNGIVEYQVGANTGPPRTGTITIAGKTFAVIQDGVEGVYGGFLDGAGCNIIAGWAWDQTNPSATVSVDIYDGAALIATTTAAGYREDLLNVLGSPNHGYSFPTPAALKDGAVHPITVKISGTNIALGGSRSVHCTEASANLQGFLDGVGCDTISGWAWDGNDQGNIINVDFYADGNLLGTIAATQYRQDLANVFGSPFHGYTFPTPASLKDGNPHSISVKFGGTNTSLSNSPKTFSCSSSPNYVGSLDPANCTSITGFVWDTTDSIATVNAAIYADGNFLVVVPAQQVSPGVGDGFHGFIFAVPASLKNGQPHSISVKVSGTNITIANSPIMIQCP